MGFFKLTKAESKKVFMRPGIFVVAFILIASLAAAALIYSPAERINTTAYITGDTVNEMFLEYNSELGSDTKKNYDLMLTSSEALIDSLLLENTTLVDLQAAYLLVDDTYTDYSAILNTSATDLFDGKRQDFRNAVIDFQALYLSVYDSSMPLLLVATETHDELVESLNILISTIPEEDDADHTLTINAVDALSPLLAISDRLDTFAQFEVDAIVLNQLKDYYLFETTVRLLALDEEITQYDTDFGTSEEPIDLTAFNKLVTNYKFTVQHFVDITNNMVYINALEGYTNQTINTFVDFSNFNLYETSESLTKTLYLFEEETFAYDYATTFSTSTTSNYSVNAYDFTFFTLELFSFIILIYVVVIGAGMIAGEIANGTMKLLAIRPYKRRKILMSKMFATLKIALIFLIIAGIVGFITGTYLFTTESLPIMLVFNAKLIFVMEPLVLLGIYLVTLFIEILFYVILAVAISTIFRSYTGAVTIATITYFGSMILGLITDVPWFKYLPFTNVNLFKYFGGSFLPNPGGVGLDMLLKSNLLPDTDAVFSLIVLGSSMLVLLVSSLIIFKNRDLN